MALIYREFKKKVSEVENELKNVAGRSGRENEKLVLEIMSKLKILSEIGKYVDSLEWAGQESTKKRIGVLIETGFNYDLTAEKCNTTKATIHVTIGRSDKRLRKRLEPVMEYLRVDNYVDAIHVFRYGKPSKTERDLLVSGFSDEISEGVHDYTLLDCVNALKVLRLYSVSFMERNINAVGRDKLEYLVGILLSNHSDDIYEKGLLKSYISGERELDDIVEEYKRVRDKY